MARLLQLLAYVREAASHPPSFIHGISPNLTFEDFLQIGYDARISHFDGGSSTVDEPIEAGDPSAEFVETELDGLSPPAKDSFGLACVAVKVIPSDLGLEASSFGTGQESGGLT